MRLPNEAATTEGPLQPERQRHSFLSTFCSTPARTERRHSNNSTSQRRDHHHHTVGSMQWLCRNKAMPQCTLERSSQKEEPVGVCHPGQQKYMKGKSSALGSTCLYCCWQHNARFLQGRRATHPLMREQQATTCSEHVRLATAQQANMTLLVAAAAAVYIIQQHKTDTHIRSQAAE